MTDAREIITRLLRREFGPHADRVAVQDFFRNIEDAGIRLAGPEDRILGPDEVDQVTVERAAEVVECATLPMGRSGIRRVLAAAIRALGRKA